MSNRLTHLLSASLLTSALLMGCTDGRPSNLLQLGGITTTSGTTLVPASDVQFDGQSTTIQQMAIVNGSLFATGKPFGFARMEIAQDMENPSLTFAISKQLDTFSPMGKWLVDWYGGGAIAVWGQTAFMSGTVGTSVVTMAQTTRPVEVQRYPAAPAGSTTVPSDANYIYSAMTMHPTQGILYAFTRQDNVFTWNLTQGRLDLMSKDAYGAAGQTVCCAMGAATFNNQVYVAFRDRLLIYSILSNGKLQRLGMNTALNPTNVVATAQYLYVQHDPTSTSIGSGAPLYPQGIYVFNTQGANVGYFAAGNPARFAVSPDNSRFYGYIAGSGALKIYRISWTK